METKEKLESKQHGQCIHEQHDDHHIVLTPIPFWTPYVKNTHATPATCTGCTTYTNIHVGVS